MHSNHMVRLCLPCPPEYSFTVLWVGAYAVGKITDEERFDVVRHSCSGAGACGGMFTANTMSAALEVIFGILSLSSMSKNIAL